MAILTVGPNSTFPTIAAAMAAAADTDTIQLETGYSNETATVTHQGMTVTGGATSTGIVLNLATGVPIATFTLAGNAPINVFDNADGGTIIGNDGNNVITVTAGVDAVNGGAGTDRLVVDYHLGTTAVTGDSTSNFTDASGRSVTINGGFEHFTILTGSGADTITTGAGDDIIFTGEGVSTVTAGEGANRITGGSGADTITAGDGGNVINGGDGTNTITSGSGNDIIITGLGADTIVAGGGADMITVRGGADTVDSGAGNDRLIVDYSASTTAVTGGVTGGNLGSGYTGHIADLSTNTLDFVSAENFTVVSGNGNDVITTGDGIDVLIGGAGNDRLDGAGGADNLRGGSGIDVLIGGAGHDILLGGLNHDILTGGTGRDFFDFNSLAESKVGAGNRDTITDFTRVTGDEIDLRGIDAKTGIAGNQAFTWIGAQDFHHEKGELHYKATAAGNVLVEGDVNGDGKADFQIIVLNHASLSLGDFIL